MAKSRKKKGNGTIRVVVAVCILGVMLVGFYYYLAHKSSAGSEEETKVTKSQQVLMRNLESNYPPSPKEVVKYYCDITQCFYNEEHTEEEIEELRLQGTTVRMAARSGRTSSLRSLPEARSAALTGTGISRGRPLSHRSASLKRHWLQIPWRHIRG